MNYKDLCFCSDVILSIRSDSIFTPV